MFLDWMGRQIRRGCVFVPAWQCPNSGCWSPKTGTNYLAVNLGVTDGAINCQIKTAWVILQLNHFGRSFTMSFNGLATTCSRSTTDRTVIQVSFGVQTNRRWVKTRSVRTLGCVNGATLTQKYLSGVTVWDLAWPPKWPGCFRKVKINSPGLRGSSSRLRFRACSMRSPASTPPPLFPSIYRNRYRHHFKQNTSQLTWHNWYAKWGVTSFSLIASTFTNDLCTGDGFDRVKGKY